MIPSAGRALPARKADMHPLYRSALLLLLVLGAASAPARAGDCLDQFRSAVHGRSLAEKNAITMGLGAKTIQCLFDHAGSEVVEPDFFLDPVHRDALAIQAFAGKNSLPVGKYFEKHFFSPRNSATVYGVLSGQG